MTQDEIIRMAREAGFEVDGANFIFKPKNNRIGIQLELERFAALVAAHERNRHAWTQEHWTQYEHAIAAAEREACAKVCEDYERQAREELEVSAHPFKDCAEAIRARGK